MEKRRDDGDVTFEKWMKREERRKEKLENP
jgi:hypothetical protein